MNGVALKVYASLALAGFRFRTEKLCFASGALVCSPKIAKTL